jgi:hypothetical protein
VSKTFTGALTLRSADGKVLNLDEVEMVISGLGAADDRIDVVDEGGKVVAMIANQRRDVASEPIRAFTHPSPMPSLASFFAPATIPPPNRAQRRAKRSR